MSNKNDIDEVRSFEFRDESAVSVGTSTQDELIDCCELLRTAVSRAYEPTPGLAYELTANFETSTGLITNDKVSNVMMRGDLARAGNVDGKDYERIWCVNQAKKSEQDITVWIASNYDLDDVDITTSRTLDGFDMAIFDTTVNLMYHHVHVTGGCFPFVATPEQIWRKLNGIRGVKEVPTKKQRKRIVDSFHKMRNTSFRMDISKEIEAGRFNDKYFTKGAIDDMFLYSRMVTARDAKGREVEVLVFYDFPALYLYNASKKHILFFDFDLIDTRDTTGNEGDTAVIRRYLLKQINLMKNGYRDNRFIRYETLYRDSGILSPEERFPKSIGESTNKNYRQVAISRTRKADRDKISSILESWKKKGWIKDFKHHKEGRTYRSVEIIFPKGEKS